MRVVLIAVPVAAAIIALSPLPGLAQSRPAPDTPGEPEYVEEVMLVPALTRIDALRALVVTVGIIGGFIAADIFSGGTLTAPLLGGLSALGADSSGGFRMIPRIVTLRPIIATAVEAPGVTRTAVGAAGAALAESPAFQRGLGQALTRSGAATRVPPPSLPATRPTWLFSPWP